MNEWKIKFNTFNLFLSKNNRLPVENKTKPSECELRVWMKANLKIYEKNKFEGYSEKLILFESILPNIIPLLPNISNFEVWISNLEKLEEYIVKNGKLPLEKIRVDPKLTGPKREEQEIIKSLGIWKSNLIQDLKSEFKTFCMDIDLTKISSTERNKVEKKIEKYQKEDIEIKSILSEDYSKLNKTQRNKYDKIKQKLLERDEEIKIMRKEASDKLFLFNELKSKFSHLF
jgi:hypothetical protein